MRNLLKLFLFVAVLFGLYRAAGHFYQFRSDQGLAEGDRVYNIATLNVNGFRTTRKMEDAATQIAELCDANDVDVLCMQEFLTGGDLSEREFKQLFKKRFKYILMDRDEAILSRFPISGHTQQNFGNGNNSYSYNDIDFDGRSVRLFTAHLKTSGINIIMNSKKKEKEEKAVMDKLEEVVTTMNSNEKDRWSQAKGLAALLKDSPDPVILAGDFNSHPFTRVYVRLRRGLKDAFLEKGSGSGSTYRGLNGLVRTDYILHSKAFECRGFRRIRDKVSDHLMLVTSLEIERK